MWMVDLGLWLSKLEFSGARKQGNIVGCELSPSYLFLSVNLVSLDIVDCVGHYAPIEL
jgi:hypothetical protein